MIVYKMYGVPTVGESADLRSEDSDCAPKACVNVDPHAGGSPFFFQADDDIWDIDFATVPTTEEIKAVLAEINGVAPSEIEIIQETATDPGDVFA